MHSHLTALPLPGRGRSFSAPPTHHEIGIPLPAFGTAQEPRPIDDGHPGAMLGSDIGLFGSAPIRPATANLGGNRGAVEDASLMEHVIEVMA